MNDKKYDKRLSGISIIILSRLTMFQYYHDDQCYWLGQTAVLIENERTATI